MNLVLEALQEVRRSLGKKSMNAIHNAEDNYARQVFGDKYGQKNQALSNYFTKGNGEVYNNADVKGGLFSIGNAKLSKDTLLINFTSALGCPSINYCPVTQKACYAVAGENRLKDTKRKNLIVQNLFRHAKSQNLLDGLFDIAELYITEAAKTKTPIRYIRYNEAGDFTGQDVLVKAAEFSKLVRDKYGILSMAYTANPKVDPSQEVDGEPIDTIIAINRSRNDIKASGKAPDRHYFATPMNSFSSNPDINLENAYSDVEYVSDANAQRLKVEVPMKNKNGIPSIPKLNYGSWDGGEGWYYVCPCSFWKYNKDKAEKEYLVQKGKIAPDDELPAHAQSKVKLIKSLLTEPEYKELKKICNKIISPCGMQCAVCHDTEGGVTPDGERIMDYSIISATHGAGATNYDAEYAAKKRNGDDTAVYKNDTSNPHGLDKFYSEKNKQKKYVNKYHRTDAPINNELFTRSEENAKAKEEAKEQFQEQYKRLFGKLM